VQHTGHAQVFSDFVIVKDLEGEDALIRLMLKKHIIRWNSIHGCNYFVSKKYANDAYYLETIKLDSLYTAFGHKPEMTIKRSIPFVVLPDGHPKLLHLWPPKLLQAGRPN